VRGRKKRKELYIRLEINPNNPNQYYGVGFDLCNQIEYITIEEDSPSATPTGLTTVT